MANDNQLVSKLLTHNEEAFQQIYTNYYRLVFDVIYKKVKNVEATRDLTQEAFMRMWTNISQYQINTNFRAWFMTIAKNIANDYLKKQNIERYNVIVNSDLVQSAFEFDEKIKLEFQMDLKNILNETEYRVIGLTTIYHLKRREVAEIMERPLGTILRVYSEAEQKIKKYLNKKSE
jgi:RNA polymerase sigma-70 factor (ECF subfamily)